MSRMLPPRPPPQKKRRRRKKKEKKLLTGDVVVEASLLAAPDFLFNFSFPSGSEGRITQPTVCPLLLAHKLRVDGKNSAGHWFPPPPPPPSHNTGPINLQLLPSTSLASSTSSSACSTLSTSPSTYSITIFQHLRAPVHHHCPLALHPASQLKRIVLVTSCTQVLERFVFDHGLYPQCPKVCSHSKIFGYVSSSSLHPMNH